MIHVYHLSDSIFAAELLQPTTKYNNIWECVFDANCAQTPFKRRLMVCKKMCVHLIANFVRYVIPKHLYNRSECFRHNTAFVADTINHEMKYNDCI